MARVTRRSSLSFASASTLLRGTVGSRLRSPLVPWPRMSPNPLYVLPSGARNGIDPMLMKDATGRPDSAVSIALKWNPRSPRQRVGSHTILATPRRR